jgi:putative transposase
MPNKPRNIYPNNFYHVYNRAVEKRTIFYTEKDYEYFVNKMLYFKEKTDIKILAYCILPNHFHFLLKEPESTSKVNFPAIAKFISILANSYTKYFNLNKDHSGRIFQGPFRSKLVADDNYLQILINYINLNHIKHKITKKPNDWFYTSHHNYLVQKKEKIVDKDYLVDFKGYSRHIPQYLSYVDAIEEEFNLEG